MNAKMNVGSALLCLSMATVSLSAGLYGESTANSQGGYYEVLIDSTGNGLLRPCGAFCWNRDP